MGPQEAFGVFYPAFLLSVLVVVGLGVLMALDLYFNLYAKVEAVIFFVMLGAIGVFTLLLGAR
jgi:hypothetical protein